MTLTEKINRFLDILLPKFDMKRNRIGEAEEEEECSSDDSVDYDKVDRNLVIFEDEESDDEYE